MATENSPCQKGAIARCSEFDRIHDRIEIQAVAQLEKIIAQRGNALTSLGKLLDSLSYKGVLDRGFALIVDDQGHIVRSKSAVHPGQLLAVEVADGQFGAAVSGAPVSRKRPRPPKDDGGQESLF